MMNSKLVSFDFDGTLVDDFYGEHNSQKETIQKICKDLIDNGHNVFIVTKRFGPEFSHLGKKNEHVEVHELAEKLGIRKENIHFTNREWKYYTLKRLNMNVHFENSEDEVYEIRRNVPSMTVVHIENPYWKDLKW